MSAIGFVRCLACLIGPLACGVSAPAAVVHSPEELHRRMQSAEPGNIIVLATGDWRDVDLLLEGRGTADRPIAIVAEKPGETRITGRSRIRLAGEHLLLSGLLFQGAYHPDAVLEFRRDSKRLASHCRVTECRFIDCHPAGDARAEGKYVSLYGSHHRVDHCEFTGKRSGGATLVVWLSDETSGRHRIDFNYFGPRPVLGRNGGETIRIGDSQTSLLSPRCLVESNLFVECNGEAEIISNKSCENVYRHNTFRRCSGALTLRHGDRCLVEGNWFLGEQARGSGGVRIIGAGHRVINNYFADLAGDDARAAVSVMLGLRDSPLHGYAPVKSAVIAWNTLVDCKQSLVVGLADSDAAADIPPRDCLIVNNLISSRRGPLVRLLCPSEGLRFSRNLLYGAPTGLNDDSEQLLIDPALKRDAAGVHRPVETSPARGAADDRFAPVVDDIDGQPRVAPFDVGCDQRSTEPALFRPLQVSDVGPGWGPPRPVIP